MQYIFKLLTFFLLLTHLSFKTVAYPVIFNVRGLLYECSESKGLQWPDLPLISLLSSKRPGLLKKIRPEALLLFFKF